MDKGRAPPLAKVVTISLSKGKGALALLVIISTSEKRQTHKGLNTTGLQKEEVRLGAP